MTREDLEAALDRPVAVHSASTVRVPGQHPSHYARPARVVLVKPDKVAAEAELAHELGQRVGVLLPPSLAGTRVHAQAVVAVLDSAAAYARGLYGIRVRRTESTPPARGAEFSTG